MNRFIASLLALSLIGSSITFADNESFDQNSDDFISYTMSFESADEVIKKQTPYKHVNTFANHIGLSTMLPAKFQMDDQEVLNAKEEENIEKLTNYVKTLNLNERNSGLEEAYLKEIDSFLDDDGYLESYSVNVPKYSAARSSSTKGTSYFGTYDDIEFRYYTSKSNTRYDFEIDKKSDINDYLGGAADLVMLFSPFTAVNIGYTLLRNMPSNYEVYRGDTIEANVAEEAYSRFVLADDVNGNPGHYIAVYTDQKKKVRTTILYKSCDPDVGTDIDAIYGPKYVYTPNYKSKSKALKIAYNMYVSGDGTEIHSERLPNAKIYID